MSEDTHGEAPSFPPGRAVRCHRRIRGGASTVGRLQEEEEAFGELAGPSQEFGEDAVKFARVMDGLAIVLSQSSGGGIRFFEGQEETGEA